MALAGPTTPSPTSRPPWAVDPAFAERYAPDKTSTVLTRHSQPATPTPLQNRTSIVQAAAGGGTGGCGGSNGKTPVCHQCHKVIRWVFLFLSYPGHSCPDTRSSCLSNVCSPICLPTHLSCLYRRIRIQFSVGVGVGTWLDPQILNLTPLPPLAFISVSPGEMEEVPMTHQSSTSRLAALGQGRACLSQPLCLSPPLLAQSCSAKPLLSEKISQRPVLLCTAP